MCGDVLNPAQDKCLATWVMLFIYMTWLIHVCDMTHSCDMTYPDA